MQVTLKVLNSLNSIAPSDCEVLYDTDEAAFFIAGAVREEIGQTIEQARNQLNGLWDMMALFKGYGDQS